MAVLFAFLALFALCSALPTERVPTNFDEFLTEGDMKFTPGYFGSWRSGILGSSYRWTNNEVIFTLGASFTAAELTTIREGFAEIEGKTCIRFVQRTNQANYVSIVRGGANSGCWSYVGRIGGNQQLNLQAPGCVTKGIVAHELIHAIGYFHEQSRTDRDDFVTINWSNIQSGTESNFDKYSAAQVSPFGVTYDYGSIMHYSATSFAVNPNEPTIIPKQNGVEIGQRLGLSEKDAQKINNMYQC